MQDVFAFRWQVATGGYEWIQTHPDSPQGSSEHGLYLIAHTPPLTARIYTPLEQHPALFRVFSETPPTEEGILAFANQYGWLGDTITKSVVLPNNRNVGGELLQDWQRELTALKQAVAIWDLTQAGDEEPLAAHIVWTDKGVAYQSRPKQPSDIASSEYEFSFWIIASEQIRPDLLARFQPGEVGRPALSYVQQVVNQHLKSRLSPSLLWSLEWTELGLYMMPNSLIGALWLQFAQAIAGHKQYHRCEYCGAWFEVSLEASRPTRMYCSDACRFKAYRKRQEDAYQLYTQNVPVKEIAKRLGTDVTTAKGWIKKRKEK